ncbi:MAG: hypothetical protein IAF58_07290 [Leptolyngbya sp.]|nr:hypothetical protein [Candidatus Melainabacteria bacterium]
MLSLRVKTKLFSTALEGDRDRCNGMPGSQFAKWLKTRLSPRGYNCSEVTQEDYGWGFWITEEKLTVWVAVSYAVGDMGEEDGEPEWGIMVEFEKNPLNPGQWFKGKNGEALAKRAFLDIDSLISNDPQMDRVEWS